MAAVGCSSNSLRMWNLPLLDRLTLFREKGATAVELSFVSPGEMFEVQVTPELRDELNQFEYVSIHAPRLEVMYQKDPLTEKVIAKLRSLCNELPIQGIVLHPDRVVDFQILIDSKLPFLIENMDHRKKTGTSVEHIQSLMNKTPFKFVLDIQHAYEFDPSMKFAVELLELMGERLQHIHVSGCKGAVGDKNYSGHVPLYVADNKDAIEKFLNLQVDLPKISEGMLYEDVLIEDFRDTVAANLKFIQSHEK